MELILKATPQLKLDRSNAKFDRMFTFQLNRTLQIEKNIVVRELDLLTSTWNHYPGFDFKSKIEGDDYIVEVTTDDAIFFYVDQGTSVRYATMTENFEPKTKAGSLRSGRGAGGLAYVDRRVERPGIQARQFMRTLRNKREVPFQVNIERATNRALSKWWLSLFGS